jgi:predicted Zn-dependent protease with MMP-like domain
MPDAPELDEFESLVADAIDRLPEEFQKVLEKVAVVVSDRGGGGTRLWAVLRGRGRARKL